MLRTTLRLMAAIPRARPTPSTAPDQGMRRRNRNAGSGGHHNGRGRSQLGGKSTARRQVRNTLADSRHHLETIGRQTNDDAGASEQEDQGEIAAFCPITPVWAMLTTAATGPIALATSLEPCAKAIPHAVTTMSTPKTLSTV